MKIGTGREIKNEETRVGVKPADAGKLVDAGHQVVFEIDAGVKSNYSNDKFFVAGTKRVSSAREVYRECDILVKVKEPQPKEYKYFEDFRGKVLFTFLHNTGVDRGMTETLLKNKVIGIAYELVENGHGNLPLLEPMSIKAGEIAVEIGEKHLADNGTSLDKIVIIGGGIAGSAAARRATALASNPEIYVFDVKGVCINGDNIVCLKYDPQKKEDKNMLDDYISKADLVVGAVLTPGERAPIVITRDMISSMKKDRVIVDISIDQGGCVEDIVARSIEDPYYIQDGVAIYAVPNMPAMRGQDSTVALTDATFPYVKKIADLGIEEALKKDKGLAKGVVTYKGKLTNKAVADYFGMEYTPLASLLSGENEKEDSLSMIDCASLGC